MGVPAENIGGSRFLHNNALTDQAVQTTAYDYPSKAEVDDYLIDKADKVIDAIQDNIAGLNEEGNLIDTGFSFLTIPAPEWLDGGEFGV